MALTKVSTDGVKDDAITKTKIPANQIEASELADNAVDTNAIADQAVALSKLPHGTSSNDGKFLRANNGADPTFETVSGTTINNNADNRVITGSGTANTLNGEAGLTFDGSQFTTSPTLIGSGNISKTQDGVVIQRNSSSGAAEIVAGRSGGNYGQMQYFVAGASGVTKRHQIDYQSNFLWYDEDGSTEMMRLQHNNRLGIGTTSPTHKFQVADGTTAIGFSRDANNPQVVFDSNNLSSAAIIQAYESSGGGGFQFFTKDTGGTLRERARITNFGGITFNGDSGTGNALDDYEEGTFSPTIGGTSSNPTQSYANQTGYYTKIGNLCFISVDLTFASSGVSGGSGEANLESLPFNVANLSNNYGITASVGYSPSWGSITPTSGYAIPNQNFLKLMGGDKDTGTNFVQSSQVGNSTRLIAGFTYRTA